MMKKLICILFVLAITLTGTINVMTSYAANIAEGRLDEAYWWIDEGGTLKIRALNGASSAACLTKDRTQNTDWPWDDYRDQITKVEFTKGTTGKKGLSFNTKNANRMFADCPNLESVSFTGAEDLDAYGLASMFRNCTNLKTVDLSGENLVNSGLTQNMQYMFMDSGVETVKMPGSKFSVRDDALMAGMFQGCKSLKTVEFTGMDVTAAKTMTDMFNGCTSLETLDVSSFGTLTNIVNMDGFVKGCTSLATLDISNMDNSNIKPFRPAHAGNPAWGHELGIDPSSTPNLTTLIADDSKVYMCINKTGSPDNQPYNAAYNNDILYFTEKQADFTPTGGSTVTIETKRDYVDLITARGESGARGADGHSEADTNKTYGLNTNGAGFLAPGKYEIKSDPQTDPEPSDIPSTRYRITGMGSSQPVIAIEHDPDSIFAFDFSRGIVRTKEKNRDYWGEGDHTISQNGDTLIRITYPNAAVDFYGNQHNVEIEIKSITFKDQEKIPYPENRVHNANHYADDSYYRTILQAKNGQLEFQNYVYSANAKTGSGQDVGDQKVLSNGSGTYIDFDIKIPGAPEGSTLLFYIDDLDVPHAQNWIHSLDDACYDMLPWDNVVYGKGSEGMILGDGNNLDTLTFSEHTGLQRIEPNYVVATGSDPTTSWSEFYVQAAATGANYTWTSGIGCTTYLLKNTAPPEEPKDAILTNLKAEKVIEGRSWKETDLFDMAIVLPADDTTTPVPKESQTFEKDGLRYYYVTIGNDDRVKGDAANSKRRQKSLGEITYTIDDMKDQDGGILAEKTFEYTVKELLPEDGVSPRIEDLTYSTEEYTAEVKVVLDDKTDPDVPKLVIDSITYKKASGGTAKTARFTNTHENEDIYTVTYFNGRHGKSSGGKKYKKYGATPQGNTVTPDRGYRFTGKYKYVIKDKDGKIIKTGTTNDPQSIKVTGNLEFTPFYEKIPDLVDPDDPDEPDPTEPEEDDEPDPGIRTGEEENALLWIGLFAAACFALLAARRRKN